MQDLGTSNPVSKNVPAPRGGEPIYIMVGVCRPNTRVIDKFVVNLATNDGYTVKKEVSGRELIAPRPYHGAISTQFVRTYDGKYVEIYLNMATQQSDLIQKAHSEYGEYQKANARKLAASELPSEQKLA